MSSRAEKKVIESLTEDKAKRDASYGYGKGSVEPVAEGAFKGALSSSIASRMARESKFLSKKMPKNKAETIMVGAGTTLGAVAGKIYNDKKVDKAVSARKWLSDKRKKSDYIKDTRKIYKQANEFTALDPRTMTTTQAQKIAYEQAKKKEKESSEKMSAKDIAKDTALWGVGGAIVGGLAGKYKGGIRALLSKTRLMKPHGVAAANILRRSSNARGLAGAAKWGAVGAATTAATDGAASGMAKLTEKKDGTPGESSGLTAAAGGAAMMGASGAVEPLTNRLVGKHVMGKKDKFGDMARENASKMDGYKSKAPGRFNSVSKYIPFMGEGKGMEARQIKAGMEAGKKSQSVFKGLLKPTLRSASRYGIAGAVGMYGLHRLGQYLSGGNNNMQKTASLSGNDLLSAENADAQNVLDSSRMASIGRKAGIAALAYGLGSYMSKGHASGLTAAKMTAFYSVPKLAKEEYNRHNANDFLSKTRGEKLSEIRKKEDGKKFGTEDLVGAYIGSRLSDKLIDKVIGPRDVSAHIHEKNKAKEKFSIKDSL